jgi:hypothetical protein
MRVADLNHFLASHRASIVQRHDDIEVLCFADCRRGELQTGATTEFVDVQFRGLGLLTS